MDLPEFGNRHGERIDAAFHPGGSDGRLVIIGHGVTGNKDRPLSIAVAEGLAAAGWNCLRISFSGNGDSEGRFEDATITKECGDLLDVIGQLPEGLRVAYCGHSMGAAVGVKAALAESRIEVLVSLGGMVRTALFCDTEFGEETPGEGCMWDEEDCPLSRAFVDDMHAIGDLLAEAGKVGQPWLLVHGTADDVVQPIDSRDAHAAAPGPKRLVEIEGAGHVFDDESYGEVVEAIDKWLGEQFG
jgi:pimeloyl-ACP methyl ester carboxylesterase